MQSRSSLYTICLFLVIFLASPSYARAAPEDDRGLVVLKLSSFDADENAAVLVEMHAQPWRGKSVPWRGVYLGAKMGGDMLSDFSSFERKGAEFGYLLPGLQNSLWLLSASAGVTVDHWDVWHDDDQQRQGRGFAVGAIVRPLVRLSFVELSIPFEAGYSKAIDANYVAWGISLGLALF